MGGASGIRDPLPTALAVIDKDLRVVSANRAVSDYKNKSRARLIGRAGGQAFECISHFDTARGCGFGTDCIKCKLRQAVSDAFSSQTPEERVETATVFRGEGERLIRITVHPLTLKDMPVALVTLEDVTEAAPHEQVRMEREKAAVVTETAGAICHEFSQPLQVILGFCEILLEHMDLDDETRSAIHTIKDATELMADLNYDLMNNITRYQTKPYLGAKIIDIFKSAARPGKKA